MAPSRALLRCAASAQRCSTQRLFGTTCRIRNYTTSPSCVLRRPSTEQCSNARPHTPIRRLYSQDSKPPEAPDYLSEGELHIFNKIKKELEPVKLEVQDISGGCGSMYALEIESAKFKGLPVIKQHKLVNSILADEIKSWHGVQLRTKAV